MSEKWKDRLTDQLCEALLSLNSVDEMYGFLEDVATIGEIRALAQRLEVARLLDEGYTYPQIAQQKFLEYGADGYRAVLGNLKKSEETKEEA